MAAIALGVDGNRFTIDGRIANAGLELRGAPLAGVVLGVWFGSNQTRRITPDEIQRAGAAGVNAIGLSLPVCVSRADVESDRNVLAQVVKVASAVGLVIFIECFDPFSRSDQRRDNGDGGEAHHNHRLGVPDAVDAARDYSSFVAETFGWLSSHIESGFALAINFGSWSQESETISNIVKTSAAANASRRGLIGATSVPRRPQMQSLPDFSFCPTEANLQHVTVQQYGHEASIPTVCIGDGDDLDDPDGELAMSVRAGQSWFLHLNGTRKAGARSADHLSAFLETVRAARAAGRAPSDHPTVVRADMRHAFRSHVKAIRGLNLGPANAPGSAPR